MSETVKTVFCRVAIFFLACFIFIHPVVPDRFADGKTVFNPYGIRSNNPYVVNRLVKDGSSIDEVIVPGGPVPPPGFSRRAATVPVPDMAAGVNAISNVPALTWCFGCSATSAAMMFGHYDNSGYPNMYTGPTNGGLFPMTNAVWGSVVINGETRALCPLSATRLNLDGRIIKGHADDYWVKYGSSAADPYIGNWPEHAYGECTGDYMGTNQSTLSNVDASTTFYYYTNGRPLYNYTGSEPERRDGCHGMRVFVESRGYTVETNFSQYIYGYNGNTEGFTFDDFKAEIDAGRPVLIHIVGHTMLGYGYDDAGSIVYLHDTWDYSDHSMTWGGSYAGSPHLGVTVIRVAGVVAAPTVITTTPSSVTSTSAHSGGNVTSEGSASVTARGVCWSQSANPTIFNDKTIDGAGAGGYSSSISGLIPGSTYHVRAYATNSAGTGYGGDQTFTTPATVPTVTTTAVSSVTSTGASSGGNVTFEGGASVTERGVCWGSSADPTIFNDKTIDGAGAGGYSSSISGLIPGSTYHVRAYATNSMGTGYGRDLILTTLATVPTVATAVISSVTATSASSGGNVTFEGGASVTARGVCWSQSANPTIFNNKTIDGAGAGGYSS